MKNSKLGFGFMRLPKVNGNFNIALIERMVDVYIQCGGNYFDTAFIYDGSEEILRKVLVERYTRTTYAITTKLPVYQVNETVTAQSIFETSLSRLGVDFIDNYLLHGIDRLWSEIADERGIWVWLSEQRKAGNIRRIGFSFHGSPSDLDYILEKHSEVDFVQLQINYLDWDSEKIQSKRLYETASKHNKPIIVMEPIKGGLLASPNSSALKFLTSRFPKQTAASFALRFVAQLKGIETILSGMNSMEQLQDNLKVLTNPQPLNETESTAIAEVVSILNAIPRIPCTECGYCVDSCPKQIKIPHFISFLNETTVYGAKDNAQQMYDTYTGDGFYASTCIACRQCEERCPQKIAIVDAIAQVSQLFDH
jgi:predicted aldo/keto reductase-like oxidoreductase